MNDEIKAAQDMLALVERLTRERDEARDARRETLNENARLNYQIRELRAARESERASRDVANALHSEAFAENAKLKANLAAARGHRVEVEPAALTKLRKAWSTLSEDNRRERLNVWRTQMDSRGFGENEFAAALADLLESPAASTYKPVAQSAEQRIPNAQDAGSIPAGLATNLPELDALRRAWADADKDDRHIFCDRWRMMVDDVSRRRVRLGRAVRALCERLEKEPAPQLTADAWVVRLTFGNVVLRLDRPNEKDSGCEILYRVALPVVETFEKDGA